MHRPSVPGVASEMRRSRRVGGVLLALVIPALGLAACDSGTSTDVEEDFTEVLTGSVGLFGVSQHLLTVPRSGDMTLALTWPGSEVSLRLYLTDSACTGYPPTDCDLLESEPEEEGDEVVIQRSIASGEVFKVWVDNFDSNVGSSYTLNLRIR